MKKKEFEDLVKSISPKLYSFIFALVPDDLQAQQIVIDTLTIMALQEKDSIKNLVSRRGDKGEDKGPGNEKDLQILNFKKRLFRHSYKLAFKRYHQLREIFHFSKSSNVDFRPFYQLEIEKRAMLFLKTKTEFTAKDIGFILSLKEDEVRSKLNYAKDSFLDQLGYSHLKNL